MEKIYKNLIEPNMIKIVPNDFMMGAKIKSNMKYVGEEPRHKVKLSPFYVCKVVVTNGLYQKFKPNHNANLDANLPVTNVTWYEALEFASLVGCRLLTEAEWEYCCRGGSSEDWCSENENNLIKYAWYAQNSNGKIHNVALLKPNNFGLYDFHGNVWEWCMDTYEEDFYERSDLFNPINDKFGLDKVCRGGSMNSFSEMCRCSFRYYEQANFKAFDLGFRLAKTV